MSPAPSNPRDLVFLGHATDRSGPPIYLLHLLRWLADHTPVSSQVLALAGGSLATDFEAVSRLRVVGEPNPVALPRGSRPATQARNLLRAARLRDIDRRSLVHINTAFSVRALRYLPRHVGPVVAHVHELEVGLDYHLPRQDRELMFSRADHWVAASKAVANNLVVNWGVAASDIVVHYEMIDTEAPSRIPDEEVAALRKGIAVGPDTVLVGTTAVLNWRKGPDLFIEMAARVIRTRPDLDVQFAWVGLDTRSIEVAALRRDARRAGIADRLHLIEVTDQPEAWMRAFDVFVLPAREDAYPLACLEAAAAARPVICFEAGGMPEFVGDDAGAVLDFPDVDAMTDAVVRLGADPTLRRRMGRTARDRVVERHDISVAAPRMWADLARWMPSS